MTEHAKYTLLPWIQVNYLEELPRYDPDLISRKRLRGHSAELVFDAPFGLLLFLYAAVDAFLKKGMSWDVMEIDRGKKGSYLLRLTVSDEKTHNKMGFRFKNC